MALTTGKTGRPQKSGVSFDSGAEESADARGEQKVRQTEQNSTRYGLIIMQAKTIEIVRSIYIYCTISTL